MVINFMMIHGDLTDKTPVNSHGFHGRKSLVHPKTSGLMVEWRICQWVMGNTGVC